ncbi:hypothetical protein [Micromonospora sp. NPDC005197]|uniref:hypothetical protein n=1 Tax=unclassified Micromonospora TaxID=2617518 RepID=UPI0033A533C4
MEELTAITQTARWRLAVRSFRLALVIFPLLIILTLLAGFDDLETTVEPLAVILFVMGGIVVITGWFAAILLARDTTRMAVGKSGLVDPVRTWLMMQHLVRDICNFRRW